MSETRRCFTVQDDVVKKRAAAPQILLSVASRWLEARVPWADRSLRVADPGQATILVDGGRARVGFTVPAVSAERQAVKEFELTPRAANSPIRVRLTELKRVASEVDARESSSEWPSDSLPPLNLGERLDKLIPNADGGGFFDGETFTLNGATHVVGMLSSGKSTFVTALLLALTQGPRRKRVAVLVSNTMQGATLSARLRHHGIDATVLASFRNREKHLQSIHWQRGLQDTGWSLSSIGDLTADFSTACPLDGSQTEPELLAGETNVDWRYPRFAEKPCHGIYQSLPHDEEEGRQAGDPDDVDERGSARACPLWANCPAQAQQRAAVEATVLIMTPAAFVHITPAPWTSKQRLSLPELVQYEYDLVIVDEVDNVQKSLDETFALRTPIMGDRQDTYAPGIGLRSSEAIRRRSGSQFRKPLNAKWQSNFFAFFRLIGGIYAILQNEREALAPYFKHTTFTAGSILYNLWRRQAERKNGRPESVDFDDPEVAREFQDVVKVAGAISRYDRGTSVSEDPTELSEGSSFSDSRFSEAAVALQEVARRVLVTDYYDDVCAEVETELTARLVVFSPPPQSSEFEDQMARRSAALALVLATITDLALSHYNWLVKTQSAVASDFQIDDGALLGRAGGLIKNYRTLLPANPAGAAFGFLYDEPPPENANTMGGGLSLISHLGVGRHLLTHLHDLLESQGQAGPHTLFLSGTSWAGGSMSVTHPKTKKPMSFSSPMFDIQLPVNGVFVQPEEELKAIRLSRFALVQVVPTAGGNPQIIPNSHAHPQRVSGTRPEQRKQNLEAIAARLAFPRGGRNQFEKDWQRAESQWSDWREDVLDDRRRALLVTNSYADAATTADALAIALQKHGRADWSVYCLVPDGDETEKTGSEKGPRVAHSLPRSLVERFGERAEQAVLIGPMLVVGRGHNILNRHDVAAISSIYFLHRVHPRPDDLGPLIGRLNRFAQERFDAGVQLETEGESVAKRALRMRHAANRIVRRGLEEGRGGYSTLPREYKAQFAWDTLALLWQTIGRGIRGGRPVFVGFVDVSFAPLSFTTLDQPDTASSSTLVQCIKQMRLAVDTGSNPAGFEIARLLYQPFYDALRKTEGLRIAEKDD